MVATPLRVVRYGFYAVFDPSKIVGERTAVYAQTRRERVRKAARLVSFYLTNLFVYAVPLTYAGFGATGTVGDPPAIVGELAVIVGSDPATTWQFLSTLIQNCSYLLLFSVLTFGMFHLAVWLTRNSSGFLQSIHTVVYSTGIYLAAIFSFTWYLSTSPAIVVAEGWLIWIQAEFIYTLIDLVGANLELPGGRPDPVDLGGITQSGALALAGLFVSVGYYLYSLYLGSRINHESNRFAALIAVAFVIVSPILFVLGSILLALSAQTGTVAAAFLPI
ncbi:hypothetical protein EA462_15630 [Natrarchaeobius halalkaliphilus]|uniref:Yip1 domain-containing protein n=1 Tax=Natrarchaeobius halalkaliphilus TaxID=1679091 RepID=A0A3N6LZ72_9EURY|nr:hypothetical protein [Natrarchaeobius halalkaliphilus]RQG87062.1 hypothetical protein EA462_15630 [Natrarchaeobius halalkaliphilus]